MLKRMRRIGLFVLAIAVVISSAIIASANERSGTTTGSATAQTTASSYVIENKSSDKKDITVTVEHYDSSTGKKIYSSDVRKLSYGSKINDYAKAINWDVSSVTVDGNAVADMHDIKLNKSGSATVVVNYTAKSVYIDGEATFYDYVVKGVSNTSINSPENYGNDNRNKLIMGTNGNNYYWLQQQWLVNQDRTYYNPNNCNYGVSIRGLVSGLDNNGNVLFNYANPGFFDNNEISYKLDEGTAYERTKYLKKIYKNYVLNFSKIGDSYKLFGTTNINTNTSKKIGEGGKDFFPLDDVDKTIYTDNSTYDYSDSSHNYFFGMRYDVEFTIGDYVGDLTYKFSGDDDMWVVLDNTNVVIDLGGIHDAQQDTVDLWSKLGLTPGSLNEEQKNQTHKLTILYMERGAGASNCQMEFTLPNAKVVDVTEKPKAGLNLQKVDEDGNGLSDAVFKLENDSTKEVSRVKSTSDGNITFSGLKEGTYTLTEVSAPDGYVVSDDTWKVRITVDSNNNAVAKLYLIKDGQEQEVSQTDGKYKIKNEKIKEVIENSLQYDKTAKVKDWNERTYDINITAKSLSTSSSVVQKEAVADIMMVLDISGSMLYNGNSNNPTDNGGFRTVGKYCDVKNSLDVNKVYYYSDTLKDVSYKHTNGNSYTYKNAKYPMIYINDTWKYYNGSSWTNVPDKISSGKWNQRDNDTTICTLDSGLTGLKEASSAFISATAESSENSRIGVATFNAYGNNISNLVNARDNKDRLKQKIASIYAAGGTSPQEGLSIAQTNLANSKRTDVPQYVILFTDGAPSEDTDKNDSKEIARQLREAGITVYTVGLKLNDETSNWLSENIASTNCAFTAANVDELKVIFAKIQQTISQNIDIKNANIVDVIDPRFQLVGNDGNVITDEALKQGEIEVTGTNGKVGMAYYDEVNNTQAIRWTDQTIPNVNTGEWNTTITVKARDKYIGGDNVPTNVSPDSKITTGFGEAILPQPKVNVKVDFVISNDDIWINSGETVSVDKTDIGNAKVFDTNTVINSKGTTLYKYNETSKQFEKVTKDDLTFQWYKDVECKTGTTKDEISKVKPDGRMDFFLKVGYDGGSATDESNANTTKTVDNQNVVYKVGDENSNIGYAINDGKINHTQETNDVDCQKDFTNCKNNKSEYGIYRIHVKYILPETGGTGIYWYTVGGMLLMVIAAIVVYRKRYNEYMNK